MSVSTEVQRTIVKSPPELWSELSNPEALARHLGDLGEIRITNVEPETKVEWESEVASGIVHLKQSGWGTRVTLSVTRAGPTDDEPCEPEAAAEPEPQMVAVEPTPIAESEPAAIEPEPEPEPQMVVVEPEAAAEPEPEPQMVVVEPEAAAEPEHEPQTVAVEPAREPQLGFFARLFRRRKTRPRELVEEQPPLEAGAEPEPEPEIEVIALAAPEPIYPDRPVEPETAEPAGDLAGELESVETQMAEETTELLTGILDRLGAAHHRPFSRG